MTFMPVDMTQDYMKRRILNRSVPEPNTGCWLWEGSTGNSGYGKLRVGHSQDYSAHRISFLAFNGPISKGLCVLHKCDVRICVNPDHLFLGTKKQNSQDMVRKGRNHSPQWAKTNCPKGHDYSGLNSQGRRICAICNKETRRRYSERVKLRRKREACSSDSKV